jgi:hypothetical protein
MLGLRRASASRTRTANGVEFERLATGDHQHHERAGQVLAKEHRGDDRDAGQKVGAELQAKRRADEIEHDKRATDGQTEEERQLVHRHRTERGRAEGGEAEGEMDQDGGEREQRDAPLA